MTGTADRRIKVAAFAAAAIRAASIGWAVGASLPTEAQGTDLLAGEYAGQVAEEMFAFLREQRWAARSTSGVQRVP